MKFIDIFKTIIIILIFGLLYFSAILAIGMKKLEEDWPKYRCVPTMMPFASYLGKDTLSNFVYCVGNIQKDLMSYFLEPIQYVLGMVGGLGAWILERVQFIRVFITKLRSLISGIVGDIYGMFVNVLIQFQSMVINLKDTMGKIVGLMITIMYLLQGAMYTGQSIYGGPIGSTLRTVCFSKTTPIKLKTGETIEMKDIRLGDILENGTEVYGLLKLKGDPTNPFYKIWSEKLNSYIYVTGEHKIFSKSEISEKTNNLDNYVDVKDYDKSIKTDIYDDELACLITNNHQIPVGEFIFWDWED